MSRRDTIIIAVLVNAGLLMVLFATAMRSDKSTTIEIAETPPVTQEVIACAPVPTQEDLLTSYASAPTLGEPGQEIVLEEALALTLPPPLPLEAASQQVLAEPMPAPVPVREPTGPAPRSQSATTNVTVKKGDALEKIARANKTSVAAIMEANRLSSTKLKIGQVLKVPVGEKANKSGGVQQTGVQPSGTGDYYLVKEGDSPWLIASKNHIQLEELLRINGLDEHKARRLRPGDRLRIR